MYLAGILGLCALLNVPLPARVGGSAMLLIARGERSSGPMSQQAPTQQTQPDQAAPAQTSPASAESTPKPPDVAPVKNHSARKKPAAAQSQVPKKKVVRQGSTGDATTQLTPGVNEAEAARQRESTKELLSATDANLQRLSTRLLTKDQEDNVAQIRVFMEQAKAADTKGDLERASKLAVKAHLLSEAITKQ
jgi:hypothetical protein